MAVMQNLRPDHRPAAARGRVRLRAAGALAVVALAVSGCGAVSELSAWSQSALQDRSPHVELGIAELAKGNFLEAENRFDMALAREPDDAYALLAKAILYQSTERPDRARELYERLIRLQPDRAAAMGDWSNLRPQNIVDIAKANLLRMELARSRAAPSGSPSGGMGSVVGEAEAMAGAMAGATAEPMQPAAQPYMASPRRGLSIAGLSLEERNVLQRFELLRSLRDSMLVTEAEHERRRTANIGALLPLTEPSPAAGLGRPPPPAAQVRERLEALGRSLQSGAVTPREQQAERTLILDAILPAVPGSHAPATLPPTDIMAAAAGVGRLERLLESGLIIEAEYRKEREAIEAAIRRATVGASVQSTLPESRAMPNGRNGSAMEEAPRRMMPEPETQPAMVPARPSAPATGIHLASYRSEAAAEKGWELLSTRFRDLLGNYGPVISRVDLGAGKGVYYRLMAGPLPDAGAARALCGSLQERQQYCRPGSIDSAGS